MEGHFLDRVPDTGTAIQDSVSAGCMQMSRWHDSPRLYGPMQMQFFMITTASTLAVLNYSRALRLIHGNDDV